MMVRTAYAGTPPTVIPAKAGIHTASTEHDCAIREGGPGGATSTQTRPFSGGMTSVFTFFYMFR